MYCGEVTPFRIPCAGYGFIFRHCLFIINPVQAERLYSKAIEYAALTGSETVWDLYCGIGTITLAMARKAGQVYGVESIPQAIEDARENAG